MYSRYSFTFKFILSCQQSDIIPTPIQICRQCRWYRCQFATGVVFNSCKFAVGIYTGGNLPLASLSTVANLLSVSLTPVANLPPVSTKLAKLVANLPQVSTLPVVHLDLWISPRIFEKIWNGHNGILWCWGETDPWNKPEAKNLVTLSL